MHNNALQGGVIFVTYTREVVRKINKTYSVKLKVDPNVTSTLAAGKRAGNDVTESADIRGVLARLATGVDHSWHRVVKKEVFIIDVLGVPPHFHVRAEGDGEGTWKRGKLPDVGPQLGR